MISFELFNYVLRPCYRQNANYIISRLSSKLEIQISTEIHVDKIHIIIVLKLFQLNRESFFQLDKQICQNIHIQYTSAFSYRSL